MTDLREFQASYDLANQLLALATKDQLADVARALAMNLARYRIRFGDPPVDAIVSVLRTSTLNAEATAIVTEGMGTLVDALWVFLEPTDAVMGKLH